MMGRRRQDILNKKETGKMCLSDGNELDEMCSVEDDNTCGDCLFAVEETLILCGLAGFFEDYVPVFLIGKNVDRK